MLALRNLVKFYNDQPAVNGVSLEIKEGEFFSLLGPSGCGKTTLLRMLGGFESPSSGEILFKGKRIDPLPPHQRNFNMVFQRYALFPHLNVWNNVAFGLRMKKVPQPEIKKRVEESLSLVRMESFGTRSVTTLSGGQQQRVALARALVNQPQVLLLDEPLSALDLKLRQEMQVELRAIQRRLKITFVFVTHDQEEALTLSDRIAVLNQGGVQQVGSPREIYENPRTEFVAGFIGSINALEVIRQGTEGPLVRLEGKDGVLFRVNQARVLTDGAAIQLMVRPEKMRLLRSPSKSGDNQIQGRIKEIIYQGPLTRFIIENSDRAVFSIIQSNLFHSVEETFSEGDAVFASFSPEDCVVMSREK